MLKTEIKNHIKKMFYEGVPDCVCSICVKEQETKCISHILTFYNISVIPIEIQKSRKYYNVLNYLFYCIDMLEQLRQYNERMLKDNKVVYNCPYCGRLHTDPIRKICKICFDRYYIECCECKLIQQKEKSQFSIIWDSWKDFRDGRNPKNICLSCFHASYTTCRFCGYPEKKENMYSFPYKRDKNGDKIYKTLCLSCKKNNLRKCVSCGEYGETKNDHCRKCYEKGGGFFDYTYKPLYVLYQTSKNEGKIENKESLFFGYELEIDSYKSLIQDPTVMGHLIRERIGRDKVYTVHDGSITRDLSYNAVGLEIVSYPFTWNEYKEVGKYRIDDLLLFIRSKGWGSNSETCGFHIHSTKKAWGTFQIYKMLRFMYHSTNRKFMHAIAGRKPNTYCFIDPDDFDHAVLMAKDKKNRRPDHYSWVNLNNKSGSSSRTIEFRMFVGSLEPLIIHKNIEFIMAVYEFTRDFDKKKMFAKFFRQFVKDNRKKYLCLSEFIKLKGYK